MAQGWQSSTSNSQELVMLWPELGPFLARPMRLRCSWGEPHSLKRWWEGEKPADQG